MHEFSVAQNIIESIKDAIGEKMLSKVKAIHMEIGRLSGISIESLEFSIQVLLNKKGENILNVKEIEPLVECINCKERYSPEDMIWVCPNCNEMRAEMIRGNEIKIINVEVQDED
ncbi:MAG: hydrogenase maturation nickel metallochaperone HypA [Myxococcota bacterium]